MRGPEAARAASDGSRTPASRSTVRGRRGGGCSRVAAGSARHPPTARSDGDGCAPVAVRQPPHERGARRRARDDRADTRAPHALDEPAQVRGRRGTPGVSSTAPAIASPKRARSMAHVSCTTTRVRRRRAQSRAHRVSPASSRAKSAQIGLEDRAVRGSDGRQRVEDAAVIGPRVFRVEPVVRVAEGVQVRPGIRREPRNIGLEHGDDARDVPSCGAAPAAASRRGSTARGRGRPHEQRHRREQRD